MTSSLEVEIGVTETSRKRIVCVAKRGKGHGSKEVTDQRLLDVWREYFVVLYYFVFGARGSVVTSCYKNISKFADI